MKLTRTILAGTTALAVVLAASVVSGAPLDPPSAQSFPVSAVSILPTATSGYVTGDSVALSCQDVTFSTPPSLTVTASGGVVTAVTLAGGGATTRGIPPLTAQCAQSGTTGRGSGLVVSATFSGISGAGGASGSTAAPLTQSGSFNVNAQTLKHWLAAAARVKSGTGRGKVVVIGDSTTMGYGAFGGGLNGGYLGSWSFYMAKYLAANGISTNINGLIGNQHIGAATYPTYDPRVVVNSANWGNLGGTLGGDLWNYSNVAATNFVFTPQGAFDTIDLYYLKTPGAGTATINVDGGTSLGTVTFANGSQVIAKNSYSVPAGVHTINIVPANNGAFYFFGFGASLSTAPAIDVFLGAYNGALAADFAASGQVYGPPNVVNFIAPDLTIINLTVNDSNVPTNLATYISQMQTIITSAKTSGDCLLMGGPPSNTTQATNGTLASFMTALQALATTNGCGLISIPQRWTSYAAFNAVAPYADGLHPTATGYADMGAAVASALTLQPN